MTDLRDAHTAAVTALAGLIATAVEQAWDPARTAREAESWWRTQRTRGWTWRPADGPGPADWRERRHGTDRVSEHAAQARALIRASRAEDGDE